MFCNKTNGPKSQKTPDTSDFWLENEVFLINSVFIIKSSLSYLLHLL